jgi:cAMP-binding proteins - catabolite gene activator and regulatory subunit of cAMP-dependent protein kinases
MKTHPLRKLDIFQDLSQEKLSPIEGITLVKTFAEGNILFYEGEEPEYFYALLGGALKLYKTGIKSNEIVLHYFRTPTLVAEMTALESIPFPATAIVMEENTQIALIDKKKFLRLLQEDAQLSFLLSNRLPRRSKLSKWRSTATLFLIPPSKFVRSFKRSRKSLPFIKAKRSPCF